MGRIGTGSTCGSDVRCGRFWGNIRQGPHFGRERANRSCEVGMNRRPKFLLLVTVEAAAAIPAWAQTVAPAAGAARSPTHAASTPDFSGIGWPPSLPGFEPLASGPGPVTNRSRRDGI